MEIIVLINSFRTRCFELNIFCLYKRLLSLSLALSVIPADHANCLTIPHGLYALSDELCIIVGSGQEFPNPTNPHNVHRYTYPCCPHQWQGERNTTTLGVERPRKKRGFLRREEKPLEGRRKSGENRSCWFFLLYKPGTKAGMRKEL